MRDVLKIKAIKSNNSHDWANFRRMRHKVNTDIKSGKELYYKNKFIGTDNEPCKTWQLINELTSRKSDKSAIKELKLNGVSRSDLSNAFNDHFSSIGPKLANEILYQTAIVPAIRNISTALTKVSNSALLMTDRF